MSSLIQKLLSNGIILQMAISIIQTSIKNPTSMASYKDSILSLKQLVDTLVQMNGWSA